MMDSTQEQPFRGRRATNTEELQSILDRMFDDAARQRGLAFRPGPGDVIISPYAKCGTTWLQQIAHGLRTRGDMNFDEITAVTPWIDVASSMGWDLGATQVAEPRLFKSHLSYYDIPKGGRYIVSFRNPDDAFVSLYRFFEGWLFEPGTISLESLFHWRWPRDKADSQGYCYHLRSWWEQRHSEDVLLLCYEDMKADLPGTVRRVANFMGIPPEDELLDIVVRQATREFMLAHREHFDDHLMRALAEQRAGLPLAVNNWSKVTPGASDGARYVLSPAVKETLDDIWREQITARFGLETYEDLRQAVRDRDISDRET